ncbi:MAG: hypothetical protein JKY42_07990 [Flavobacteriales bacterium]|nr:hypothetical protein [Flavobacteriales bacterium]
MKRSILKLAVVFAIGSFTLVSCGGDKKVEVQEEQVNGEETHEHDTATKEHKHYQCPMKCEDDKLYEEEGKCPVCGMDIKEV